MFQKISLYITTIKYLKPVQIRYRIVYRVRDTWRKISGFSYSTQIPALGNPLFLNKIPEKPVTLHGNTFTFLNLSHTFRDEINWNFSQHGTLWSYHLNYFNFLQQKGMTMELGCSLIKEFTNRIAQIETGIEPYPVSIRSGNWIKFLSRFNVTDPEIDASLFAQYNILLDNLEYHLLGNHLLENGFSLVAGGLYFQDSKLLNRGKEILESQLEEQILDDGAHFERSPMYHSLILERVLDCYNMAKNNHVKDHGLIQLLNTSAIKMMSWLRFMTFRNGDAPHFNDSTFDISLSTDELERYARRLGLKNIDVIPGESGYRKYNSQMYECVLDVGDTGPDYQPGHAHSDTFSFVLYVHGIPVIVDRGISTYDDIDIRTSERKTSSHNTFQYGNLEQSEVWSLFRMAKRAKCSIIKKDENEIVAEHDGYLSEGVLSRRHFGFENDRITWTDIYTGGKNGIISTGFLHFHPDIEVSLKDNRIRSSSFTITCNGIENIKLMEYDYSEGFNKRKRAQKAEISFRNEMRSVLEII